METKDSLKKIINNENGKDVVIPFSMIEKVFGFKRAEGVILNKEDEYLKSFKTRLEIQNDIKNWCNEVGFYFDILTERDLYVFCRK